ncbi:MAG: transcriptional regulator FtsR [Ferrimicrobium sp.]
MTPERAWEVIAGDRGKEYSIREVLQLLQHEFPDVTISKIRFLESQGLIAPERSSAGYRRFFPTDIERLQQILKLQKSTFMPLRKIREKLDGQTLESGDLFASVVDTTPQELETRQAPSRGPVLYDLEQVCELVEATRSEIEELITHGLIHGVGLAGTLHFSPADVAIAQVVHRFRTFGVEPRHLRIYRTSTDREVGFLEQLITPILRQRNPEAKVRAADQLETLRELGTSLRALLMEQAFEQLNTNIPNR